MWVELIKKDKNIFQDDKSTTGTVISQPKLKLFLLSNWFNVDEVVC